MIEYIILVGFGPACAPVRCAHPSFWAHCHPQTGRCAPPSPPVAASLLLIWHLKIHKISAPRPAHRSFADPSGNILGSKVYTGATIHTKFFRFFSSLVFGSFPFVSLFLFFSPFQFLIILLFLSLHILLVGLFFVFLFVSSYILNCLSYYIHAY